ncbi:MAG TPA: hypothetical protein DIW47_01215 [Bacteroidetes bacterium]|nr:hypothetical protein [Bacteroidota bacterium]
MKALKTLFTLSLVTFFLSSFHVAEKDPQPVPFIVFENEAGEEITKALTETMSTDWENKVKSVEFRMGDWVIEVEGILVSLPKEGDAVMMNFKGTEGFTSVMRNIESNFKPVAGDRVILDNLKMVGQERGYAPIVHTVK